MVTKDDLEKGLAALQAVASNGNPAARKRELFAKAQEGMISDEENDELIKSLRGGSLAEEATAGLRTNDTIQKSFDVSSTLKEYVTATTEGMGALADRIEKSEADEHGFRMALAKSMLDLGSLMKSVIEQVEMISGQPARAPRAVGANAIAKSFAGDVPEQTPGTGSTPQSGRLNKAQVLDLLNEMSVEKSFVSASGENLTNAVAKYESTNQISKALADEVLAFHTEKLRNRKSA